MRPGPSPFALLRSARLAQSSGKNISRYGARRTLITPPDIPPPPPLLSRLKAIVPFFFWWSVITSLAVHRLRMRQQYDEELGVVRAQITVLESLVSKVRNGSILPDEEVRKEMEMVGLRERTSLTESDEEKLLRAKDVTWGEALFGRKNKEMTAEQGEEAAVEEWSNIIREASTSAPAVEEPPTPTSTPIERLGMARRAPSHTVYL